MRIFELWACRQALVTASWVIAVDGVFRERIEPAELHLALEFEFRGGRLAMLVNQMGDGGHDTGFVKDGRPNAADQATSFEMGRDVIRRARLDRRSVLPWDRKT